MSNFYDLLEKVLIWKVENAADNETEKVDALDAMEDIVS